MEALCEFVFWIALEVGFGCILLVCALWMHCFRAPGLSVLITFVQGAWLILCAWCAATGRNGGYWIAAIVMIGILQMGLAVASWRRQRSATCKIVVLHGVPLDCPAREVSHCSEDRL